MTTGAFDSHSTVIEQLKCVVPHTGMARGGIEKPVKHLSTLYQVFTTQPLCIPIRYSLLHTVLKIQLSYIFQLQRREYKGPSYLSSNR